MGIRWVHPEWVAGIWLVWVFVGLATGLWLRWYGRLGERYGAAARARQFPMMGRWGFLLRMVFYAVGLSLLFLALARPQWGFHYEETAQKGSELMLVVDVSQSMMAEDIHPNRLALARRALYDLSENLEGDAVGIVAFAGVPFLLCPPTADTDALRLFLDMLDPSLIPVQGTNLAGAIELARKSFNDKTAAANRALILITDGEDHGERLNAALSDAKDKGVRIFVVGLGSPQGAPVPLPEGGGFKQDDRGGLVLSKFNEAVLADIAAKTGGSFIRNDGERLDLVGLYTRRIRGELGEGETGSRRTRVYHERFGWPLALGLLCLALSPLGLPALRRRQLFALVLGAGLGLVGAGWGGREVMAASSVSPENTPPPLLYNQGNVDYEAKRYAQAQAAYEAALSHLELDSELGKEALFNLGNTLYREGELERALEAYEKLLARDPKHRPAVLNREFVKKKLEEKKNSQSGQGQKPEQAEQKAESSGQSPQPGQGEGTGSDSQPQSPEGDKAQKAKERAERWLEAAPETGEKILQGQVRRRIPRQTIPEKDW